MAADLTPLRQPKAVAVDTAPRRRGARTRKVLSWVLVAAALAGWWVYLRPASLGGPAGYVIISGASMEPLMHTGDLAIVRRQPSYEVGQVVAYRIPQSDVGGGMLVIHRVIGGDVDEGLQLQGDNRDTPDLWRPKQGDIVGSLSVFIPHAGTALFLARTPIVLATAAGLLGFWFIVLRGHDDEDVPAGAEPATDEASGAAPPEPVAVPTPQVQSRTVPWPSYRPLVTAAVVGVAIGLLMGGSHRR